jgi:hypothetical protein
MEWQAYLEKAQSILRVAEMAYTAGEYDSAANGIGNYTDIAGGAVMNAEVGADIVEDTDVLVVLAPYTVKATGQ